MTPLPQLPTNLSTDNIGTSISGVVSQGVIPQFPNLPTVPNAPSLAGLTGQVQGLISNQLSGPLTQIQQFNAASGATLALIEVAITEDQITQLFEQYRLPNGTIDFESVTTELNSIETDLTTTYDKVIEVGQLPPVSVSGLLTELIPEIPVPNIPSPAEIKQYINNVIEKRKQLEQQAIMKAQKLQAEKESLPFSARSEDNTI